MKITFLGTGSSHGIPVIGCRCEVCRSKKKQNNRLRSSIFIATENSNIIIDVGPDFRQQMLRENIAWIDAVLLTHHHKDHTAGLDDLRAFNYIQKKPIPIYGEQMVLETIKREYAYVFSENRYPGVPKMDLNKIENKDFHIKDDLIEPIRIWHNLLPILAYRISNFAYVTDIKSIEGDELKKLLNLDILVLSAIRIEPHDAHLGLDEVLNLIEELKPKKTYLTHISHMQYEYDELKKRLPINVEPAYDGLILHL